MSRANLGHTEVVTIKLHPDLLAFINEQATREYCSVAEYLRRLVIADMRRERQP